MPRPIVVFGAYDTRKPRVRLLLAALRRSGRLAEDILIPGWEGVAQTNIPSKASVAMVVVRLLIGLPGALWRLWRSPRMAAILLPYPGFAEMLLIAPLARMMRRPLVFDAFLPLYDMIVADRGMVRTPLAARAIWLFERMVLRLADVILVDTDCHGDYLAAEFGLPRDRLVTVLVGAEPQFTPCQVQDDAADLLGPPGGLPIVLFYGQLIPLHGIETILSAARLSAGLDARWVIIGRGQMEPQLRAWLIQNPGAQVDWIAWVDYARLPAVIARARLCLGVFGLSDKAGRVIPNKLFQQLAVGKPVITRSSAAVEALAQAYPQAVITVPPGDPQALAKAVAQELAAPSTPEPLPAEILAELTPDRGIRQLCVLLDAWSPLPR
ncbi:glycosyltransferase [Alteraurantiacibacter palmitatis]|uniref:Glycosyltransferase n=1 Tax=Alteraurantiacibacter palmitatis TaxID=2054628 RepID=A0ABV7E3Y9_9SPHN